MWAVFVHKRHKLLLLLFGKGNVAPYAHCQPVHLFKRVIGSQFNLYQVLKKRLVMRQVVVNGARAVAIIGKKLFKTVGQQLVKIGRLNVILAGGLKPFNKIVAV